ncbi:sensor histidine kinase N-terminal domain-containing protein [uncultured Aquincola sp.]|uniref:sensor histidine kinase n=1 Tax=uncultured Aquincola sp. TaxID=886556 RepID=UPI0032B2F8A8
MPPNEAQPTLRRTLLVGLLVPLLVLVPLTAAVIYRLALIPALDGLDRALTDTAVALSRIVQLDADGVTLPLSAQTARALQADLVDRTVFAVGGPDGRALGGEPALLALAPPLPAGQWSFFDAQFGADSVRVAAHAIACGSPERVCAIVVAETLGKRHQAERAVVLASLAGATVLALVLVALAMLAVARGLRPLQRAAAQVASLSPAALAPVDTRGVPREVVGFVHALNGLLARIRDAGIAQRAFIADAAHQLRTPLAVMRVEAAQALSTPHPEAQQPMLERLHAAAERGARLAQQLLSMARTESFALDPQQQPVQPVDLRPLIADAADRWLEPSIEAGQDLGFELQHAVVQGHPVLLEELVGNLVHNAVAHAGRGARITVACGVDGDMPWLSVEDDGPGVPEDERPLLWQRFRRGREAGGTGSGLGLAIVADIARLHGAQAELQAGAGGRGLKVLVRFPAPGA